MITTKGHAAGKSPLLEQVRNTIRAKHYSIRTEQSYLQWIRRYILFHHKTHPLKMGSREVNAFLTHLAVDRKGLKENEGLIACCSAQTLSCLVLSAIYPRSRKRPDIKYTNPTLFNQNI